MAGRPGSTRCGGKCQVNTLHESNGTRGRRAASQRGKYTLDFDCPGRRNAPSMGHGFDVHRESIAFGAINISALYGSLKPEYENSKFEP